METSSIPNHNKLLLLVFILASFLFILMLSIHKLASNSSITSSRAASSAPIQVTGVLYKLESCDENLVCYYLKTNKNEYYYISEKKFSQLLKSDKTSTYDVLDLSQYEHTEVSIHGFLVEGNKKYILITDIKETSKQ